MISMSVIREELEISPSLEGKTRRLLNSVVAKLEGRTNRLWKARTGHVQYINVVPRAEKLFLELYPVTGITEVKTFSLEDDEDEIDALEADDFGFDASCGTLWRADYLEWSERAKITLDGGYEDDAAPDDVIAAILTQMKFEMVRNSPQRIANRSQSSKGGSASSFVTDELHPEFASLVKRLRRTAY